MKKIALRALTITVALLTLALSLSLLSCNTAETDAGFTFKTPAGAEISVGDPDTVIASLGAYISVNESASCGGIPGNDRVYLYSGFRVKTTPAEGGDVICQIELMDDSLTTPEGLYIGMSAENAKTAMNGKGTYASSGAGFYYTKGNCKLQISVRGGAVSGITYLVA